MAETFRYDIDSKSASTVDVLGLDDVNVDLKLGLPQPLKTEGLNTLDVRPLKADSTSAVKAEVDSATRLAIEPLTTDSSVSVDLKPAVVDLCLTLNLGRLPNVCITQPYHHHVGFTLFGSEIWGYTFSGRQETLIQEQAPRPRLALPPPAGDWSAARPAAPPASREGGGLRVRLGP